MKLKTSLIVAGLGAAGLIVACSSQTTTIALTGTTGVDANCKIVQNTFLERGEFDVSASTAYLLPLTFENTAQTVTTEVNGQTLDTVPNNFFGQQLEVSYTSTPSATWATETEQNSFTMPAGADPKNSFVLVNIIQPKALAQLQGMTLGPLGSTTTLTLNATVKIKGNYQNGGSGETNPFTFPLTVYKSGFAGCGTGQVAIGPSTCGNLQDGTPTCVDAGT